MKNKNHEVLYPDTNYANLIIRWGRQELDIYSVDKDGDVSITIGDGCEGSSMFLDQDGIKLLIEHLQKQLK